MVVNENFVYNETHIDNDLTDTLKYINEFKFFSGKSSNSDNKIILAIQKLMTLIDKIIEYMNYNKDIMFGNDKKYREVIKKYKNIYFTNFKTKKIRFKAYSYTNLEDSIYHNIFNDLNKNIDKMNNDIKSNIKNVTDDNITDFTSKYLDDESLFKDITGIYNISTMDEYKKLISYRLKSNTMIEFENNINFPEDKLRDIIKYFESGNSIKNIRLAYETVNNKCKYFKSTLEFDKINKFLNSKIFKKDSARLSLIQHYINIINQEINIIWATYKTIISIEKEKRATYIRILNLLVPESFAIKNENSDKNGIKEIYNNQINGAYFNEINFI